VKHSFHSSQERKTLAGSNQFTTKTFGRRKEFKKPSLQEIDDFLKLGAALRQSPHLVPRGIFRFTTFEEAQQWMDHQLMETLKKTIQDPRP
jgi:hypothetical protein